MASLFLVFWGIVQRCETILMMPVCMILDKTLHQVCSLFIYIYICVCVCIYITYLDDTHTEISIYIETTIF